MSTYRAWTADSAGSALELRTFEVGPLAADEVEIAVEHCGICHSDLSMLDNEWRISRYPLVPGHEAIGRVVALGPAVAGLAIGQRVGVGWNAGSCGHCGSCHGGEQHLCPEVQPTIVGHHGAFAERLRARAVWVLSIPDALDPAATAPLLCGGITVFAPLLSLGVRPIDRVGVVGIGGLGHMALKFLRAWGCEVTAFSSSPDKAEAARGFGAHRVVDSGDRAAIKAIAGSLDLIIDTVNVPLDRSALLGALAPKGRLHLLGAIPEPVPVSSARLISGQRAVSGSPTGSRPHLAAMLDFAARHRIAPQIERFPMRRVNEALEHLRAGKARYRVVLDADFD